MDIIINASGVLKWVTEMNWEHKDKFRVAPMKPVRMKVKGIVGYIKNYGNLSYISVNKAGHMIPAYQLDVSIHLLKALIDAKEDLNEESTLKHI